MLTFYRRAAALRHQYPALRTGAFEPLHAAGQVYAFARRLEGQTAVVILNAGAAAVPVSLRLPFVAAPALARVWPEPAGPMQPLTAGRLNISVPARAAQVFTE